MVVSSSQDFQPGDVVSHSCQHPHFSLLGRSRRVCSKKGVWRPGLPSCGEWRDYHYQLSAQKYLIISAHCVPLWSTVVIKSDKTPELLHGFTMCRLVLIALLQRDLLLPDHAEHHPVQGPPTSHRSSSLPPPSPGRRDDCLQSRAVLPELRVNISLTTTLLWGSVLSIREGLCSVLVLVMLLLS